MPEIEYDSDQKHKEYKNLLDTLKKKGIVREIIAEKIKVNRSTLTRIYNEERPNPQRCLHYIELIKKGFAEDLGLEVTDSGNPYDRTIQLVDQKIDLLVQELRALKESNARIEKALNIPGNQSN